MINDLITIICLADDVPDLSSLNSLTVIAYTQFYARVHVESTQRSHSRQLFNLLL